MTPLPPQDPLVVAWHTAPKPDPEDLLQHLQRNHRLHQTLDRSVFTILCGFALLLVFEEATGRLATYGALSAIWILGIGISRIWRRRTRCSRSDAFALDTVSMLKFMIRRAKSDMVIVRCLYAGVPAGALGGWIGAKFLGIGAPRASNPRLQLIQVGAGVAALIIMTATGAILARSRHRQVQELIEKLRSMESNL